MILKSYIEEHSLFTKLSCSNSVLSKLNFKGIKVTNPFVFFWSSRIFIKWSTICSGFSIWPYSIVTLLWIPIVWASSITSNHCCPVHLPRTILPRTSGWNNSAPPPGIESKPAVFKRDKISLVEFFVSLDKKWISAAVNALIFNSGWLFLMVLIISS